MQPISLTQNLPSTFSSGFLLPDRAAVLRRCRQKLKTHSNPRRLASIHHNTEALMPGSSRRRELFLFRASVNDLEQILGARDALISLCAQFVPLAVREPPELVFSAPHVAAQSPGGPEDVSGGNRT